MPDNEVADSTDWLATSLPALAALDAALRCQVCKDFYETPMITSCSHTFCSLCIRRALSDDNKCPVCRAGEQEIKLRSNWVVEEAVEAFKKARSSVLELAKNKPEPLRSPKRKAVQMDRADSESAPGAKRLRSSARLNQNKKATYEPEPVEEEEIPATEDDEDYEPEPDDGLVPCPICQSRMKEWQVFKHIETCPGPGSQTESPKASSSAQAGLVRRTHQKTLERLPALSYSMLKETALRKKLADLKIPNQGPRSVLEKRHKEWVTLWNANCDAARPKSRFELLHELDTWEKTQGSRAPTTGRAVQNAAIIKDKDFDGAAWATRHNDSFQDLIASARKSVKQKPPQDETKEPPEQTNSEQPRPPTVEMVNGEPQTNAMISDNQSDSQVSAQPTSHQQQAVAMEPSQHLNQPLAPDHPTGT